jgi:hypothetical protein
VDQFADSHEVTYAAHPEFRPRTFVPIPHNDARLLNQLDSKEYGENTNKGNFAAEVNSIASGKNLKRVWK